MKQHFGKIKSTAKRSSTEHKRAGTASCRTGSGKTTVLVTRLGYMIYCRNIPPESILTVTYTVAATKDMSERFAVRLARIWQRDWNLGRSTESVRGLSSITEDGLERHHSNW